eukprot:CAMPEP_0196599000 /NCGR_PEP_ID=MMETSP1081-20130531/94624_1 /TAXON_ID=36882 /ORGANISM="Pyramimonas amylifera, Strain CCMP720" /LENGTH=298 /DNA_ID=CAMNT_0041924741 /DNA_START=731 /DNA_END=1627 /DNA_ORIENTATION=-
MQTTGGEKGSDLREKYMLLVRRYDDKYIWWELISLGRKLALSLGITLLATPVYKIQWSLLIIDVSLVAQLLVKPYYFKKNNDVETASLLCLIVILITSLSGSTLDDPHFLLSVMNLIVFCLFLVGVVYFHITEIDAQFSKIVLKKDAIEDDYDDIQRYQAGICSKKLVNFVNENDLMVEYVARACDQDLVAILSLEEKIQKFQKMHSRGLVMGGEVIDKRSTFMLDRMGTQQAKDDVRNSAQRCSEYAVQKAISVHSDSEEENEGSIPGVVHPKPEEEPPVVVDIVPETTNDATDTTA